MMNDHALGRDPRAQLLAFTPNRSPSDWTAWGLD